MSRRNGREKARLILFAQRWLGLTARPKREVLIAAADALMIPHGESVEHGYQVLGRFYETFRHSPSPHMAGVQTRKAARKAARAARRAAPSVHAVVNAPEFLHSFEWRKLRMTVLVKRGARCECCGASPKDGIVIHVDHIKPRRKYPELALIESNLQILCEVCNHGKGAWDETDWRADSQLSERDGHPCIRSGDGDGHQSVATRPRLVSERKKDTGT